MSGVEIGVLLVVKVKGTTLSRNVVYRTGRDATHLISGTFGAQATMLVQEVQKMLAVAYSPLTPEVDIPPFIPGVP